MLIKILIKNDWPRYDLTDPYEWGLKAIPRSFGRTFKVIDKRLFFLTVIKYGLEYKKICDLP